MARWGTVVPVVAAMLGTAVAAVGLVGCEQSASAGGLASANADRAGSAAPTAPSVDGQLAMRSDSDLFALLPTQNDFPESAFLTPSPADSGGAPKPGERKLPETDPPGCSLGNPQGFRVNAVTASLASDDAGKRTVALGVGKQTTDQGQTRQVEDWIARCSQYRTPPSFGGVEGEETVALVSQGSPALGLDEVASYEQKTTGSVRITGSEQENEVDERLVTVFGQLRGVFVVASWRDDQDQDLALELLANLIDRVRNA